VTSITEAVTTYTETITLNENGLKDSDVSIFPNPSSDYIAIKHTGLNRENANIQLFDLQGRSVLNTQLSQGSSVAFLNIQTLYQGEYILQFQQGSQTLIKKIIISR
jgi:putative heme degradation protein